jgi:phosphate transport system substrate-binding protein
MRRLALLVAVLASWVAAPAPAPAAELTLAGSTSTVPLVADLAYFYRHEARAPRISIVGGGTDTGIADAARGIVDAGLASRELGPGDPAGLRFTPIALSGVCLVSNGSNPVPGLSRAQLQELVAGTLTSWTQVPGAARTDAIVPVAHDDGTGARAVFLATFVDPATPLAYLPRSLRTAVQMRGFVRATPGALGYVDFAFAGGLHTIPYEGIPCTRATIRSGAYPARRPLGIVTRGRPRGEVRRFLRWIATSRTARRVIATRYIPAR